jgi:hypothetical protein
VFLQGKPEMVYGKTDDKPILPVPGEVFALRKLLPTTSDYDFNVHIMDFQPGESLNVKVNPYTHATPVAIHNACLSDDLADRYLFVPDPGGKCVSGGGEGGGVT